MCMPRHDPREDLCEFGADGEYPFGIALTRRDLPQYDDLAVRLTERAEREMGQFEKFLDAYARVAQDFHDRPCPESAILCFR
jgi:hypothetical protein